MMLILLVLLTINFFKRRILQSAAVHFFSPNVLYVTGASHSRMRLVDYSETKVNTMFGNICYTYYNVTTQASNIIQYLQDMGERG